ncbi:MAG: hypothetical protein ABIF09_07050, partial [Gemmatimonadota bacterium]
MNPHEKASILERADGTFGVTWISKVSSDTSMVKTRSFPTQEEAEAFAYAEGLEPEGPELALAFALQSKDEGRAAADAG